MSWEIVNDCIVVTWEVADGYVGQGRPQTTKIPIADLSEDIDKEDLEFILSDYVNDDFGKNIFAEPMQDYGDMASEIFDALDFGGS